MGEIGFPRKEFLHELKWWEVKSIIRGYNDRHHTSWEQARLIAYNVHFCMGLPKGETAPTLNEWLPFQWDKDRQNGPMMTDDEINALQAEMAAINSAHMDEQDKKR